MITLKDLEQKKEELIRQEKDHQIIFTKYMEWLKD
jgi:hypothetical protein